MIEGYKEVYYFYSKKEAIKLFKNQCRLKLAERLSKKIIGRKKNMSHFYGIISESARKNAPTARAHHSLKVEAQSWEG
jgi:hypothetical protein